MAEVGGGERPLGRYELVRRLAVGGMAELFLARATGIQGFEKLVALKRILPQYAASDEFVQMFLDEARLVATLQHPNIAQVYDIGQSDGGLFFTMELVCGEDVRTIGNATTRRGGRLPLEHALAIITGAAAGLHAAHEHSAADGRPLRIVHRDVSPSNLLVSYDGCVKVIDFGIAKAALRGGETRGGPVKGKSSYMSPEQCAGLAVDRRSDVFSLGVLLYELTTSSRLFRGEHDLAIMKEIVYQDIPSPSSRCPGFPPRLEAIILRALRRDPTERYASAQELQLALEGFARGHGLVVSTVHLGAFMQAQFADRITAWRNELSGAPRDGASPRARTLTRLASASGPLDAPAAALQASGPLADSGDELDILVEAPVLQTSMFGTPIAGPPTALASGRRRQALALAGAALAGAAILLLALHLSKEGGRADATKETIVAAPDPALTAASAVEATRTVEAAPAELIFLPEPAQAEPGRAKADPTRRHGAHRSRSRRWNPDSALPPPVRGRR